MKTFHSRDFRHMMNADDIETANDGNYDSCKGNYDKMLFLLKIITHEYCN